MISKRKHKSKLHFDRLSFLALATLVLTILIIHRLFVLQVLKYDYYKTQASRLHEFSKELQPKRGEIYASDFSGAEKYPIATNLDLHLLYAIPKEIEKPQEVAKKLAPLLEIEEEKLFERLNKNDLYEPLKHYLSDEEVAEIRNLKIKGLAFLPETRRFYPKQNLFSHVLGFVGHKDGKQQGQYGLEEEFEEILAGQAGSLEAERGVWGQWIATLGQRKKEALHGADLILTLDYTIQFNVCQELKKGVEKFGAKSGTAVVMEPQTGKILALCSFPDFDPNEYNQVKDYSQFLNPAISASYEPGSVFKAITMAGALDAGAVSPETTYKDEGFVKIGKYTIKNFDRKAHGINTMIQVLEKSLNTGAIFAVEKLGLNDFLKYVKDFGFGQLTGIGLPAEARGDISSLEKKGDIYPATASFGQGISVTPLQMVSSFSAIANQGKLMKPYLIEKIIWPDETIQEIKPEMIREVISPSTAATLGAILVSVVENGHGKKAQVPGYYVAGKTGTAQVPRKDRPGYDPHHTIGSFIGFAPIDNPRFVALVKIDSPHGVIWAESSAVPVFGKIAKFLLNYFQVVPERE